jgi:plasmid stability protein
MSQILVRNIPTDTKAMLQMLAKSHGHSMEEEVRQLIQKAVHPNNQKGLGTRIAEMFEGQDFGLEIKELKGYGFRDPFAEFTE